MNLAMIGLIEILPQKKEKKFIKFYVTTLLQQFLASSTGQAMGGGVGGGAIIPRGLDMSLLDQSSASKANSDKFIIVETNFKVYAYTKSKVQLALFKLFMRVEYAFPDLVVATLTRTSLQPAFERGITAKQIIDFLESHAHVNARFNKLALQRTSLELIQLVNQRLSYQPLMVEQQGISIITLLIEPAEE